MQGLSSMLSARGKGLLSLCEDDNFIIDDDDDTSSSYEVLIAISSFIRNFSKILPQPFINSQASWELTVLVSFFF